MTRRKHWRVASQTSIPGLRTPLKNAVILRGAIRRSRRIQVLRILGNIVDSWTYIRSCNLRHACPCAKCAPQRNDDESSKVLRRTVERLPKEKPTVRPVGNYALAFEWTNGCSSGIHRFERIWRLGEKQDPDNGKAYVHGAW